MRRRIRLMASALLVMFPFITSLDAEAHEGPPFPILVDESAPPYIVSVWADPDIGTGTFFVVLEPDERANYRTPDSVSVAVQPVSNRLQEAAYPAEAQKVRYGSRYYAEVQFDRGELWEVRIRVALDGAVRELRTRVEATPDGTIGPIGLLVYLLPFLAVGFLWIQAMRRRRRLRS